MSYSRFPTLKLLASFEATARLGTISQAAAEIHVTHSAISQNIKQLEETLGHKLFIRKGRKLEPTENALRYLADIASALHLIRSAGQAFRLSEEPNTITLKMVSTLALRWFISRLPSLKAAHPSLKLQLVTESTSRVDSLSEEADVAIGFADQSEFDGLYHRRLRPSELVLVGLAPLPETIEELLSSYSALYVESPRRRTDWQNWCAHNNIPEPEQNRRIGFPSSAQALEAASAGVGIVVTQRIFVDDLLNLKLFDEAGESVINVKEAYYFYCKAHQMERTAIIALHDWLTAAAKT